MSYVLDISNWVSQSLPSPLRKVVMLQWLTKLLSALGQTNNQFVAWAEGTEYDLEITGQVRSLNYHLNRIWSPLNNEIFITDGPGGGQSWIFREDENMPVYLPAFITNPGVDFLVNLPYGMYLLTPDISTFINRHKLPGMTWSFSFYGIPN